MPWIRWTDLPGPIRQHLADRAAERQLTVDDLLALRQWIASDPVVPEGPWWKDFRRFKLAGEGKFPKTFLTAEQRAFGVQI